LNVQPKQAPLRQMSVVVSGSPSSQGMPSLTKWQPSQQAFSTEQVQSHTRQPV